MGSTLQNPALFVLKEMGRPGVMEIAIGLVVNVSLKVLEVCV